MYLLYRVEIALRGVDPTIGLPYWDSTLDQALPDPSMSVLWSDELMGRPDSDGQGSRYFRRRIGARGQLMTRSEIEKVVTAPDVSLLLSFTAPQRHCASAGDWSALEYIHGNPHVYTGGDMGVIPTATHDPIFFMHHSMMDLIWEEWRIARQVCCQGGVTFVASPNVPASNPLKSHDCSPELSERGLIHKMMKRAVAPPTLPTPQ
ncbi:hypothetical protein ANCCAN_25907 [Ancylostoma caninum]|uniref:Tyrosinase copper-binding domain-containing protein n=1 Tax=Ancylostoma caninum TaxID=29170 RepID=A0A368FDS7_ANCCA|nr:hypothetical protein ANCCAN_25907 [Ancylostoma caninum]